MLSAVELESCISNDMDILIALLGRYRFQFSYPCKDEVK